MTEGAPPAFPDAVRALRDALDELGAPWVIMGGVAVIARGVPRLTVDVDATLSETLVSLEPAFEVFRRHDIVARILSAIAFARERHVLLLRHDPSGVSLDVSLAWLPFEEHAIRHGDPIDFAGVTIRVARAEDLINYNAVAGRPQDLDDVEKLLLYGPTLDLARIRSVLTEFAEALDDPARVTMLERLLHRTGLD